MQIFMSRKLFRKYAKEENDYLCSFLLLKDITMIQYALD